LLDRYKRHIEANLPVEARAKLVEDLAQEADRDLTKLKAIQYLDSMTGLRETRQPEAQRPTAMLMFPEGSRPIINLGPQASDDESDGDDLENCIDTEAEEIEE
jgi:hypothetical protein